ncbi:MAG: efflux RND transporter permease subunit [Planctomycetota bacterium]
MKIIQSSIRYPHSVVVVIALGIIFGYLALQRIPIQLKPSLDKPEINVDTDFRGASPFEVEEQITKLIEEQMDNVEGVKKIKSTSSDGRSAVILEFDWGVNKDKVLIDVINKLNQVSNLPEEAEASIVTSVSADETEPIMWMVLISKSMNPNQIFEVVDDVIEPQIRRIEGVGNLNIFGGEEREMQIKLSPESLVSKKVTIRDLLDSLRRENLNIRGGFLDEGKRHYQLRTVGQFTSPQDVGNIIVARNETGSVYLKDLATIEFGYKKTLSIVRANGYPTIAIGVRRKAGSNVVAMCRALNQKIKDLNEEFLQKRVDIDILVVYEDVEYIDQALQLVWDNLIAGSILASIVLILFLKSIRSTLIVALTIPACMVMVFIFIYAFKRTLNIISLAGLAFSSGMIVDNSIVVIENIYRHLSMQKTPSAAAEDGTEEVWGAVLISTLTTLCVFIPIIFIEEEAGQLFKDIAIAISIAIFLSLILSVTMVPMLCALFLKTPKLPESSVETKLSFLKKIQKYFGKSVSILFYIIGLQWIGTLFYKFYLGTLFLIIGKGIFRTLFKFLILGGIGFIFWISLSFLPNAEYLPSGNRNLILVFAKPLVGTNLEKVVECIAPFEKQLQEDKRISRYFTLFGGRFNAIGIGAKAEYATEQGMKDLTKEMFMKTRSIVGFESLFPNQASIFRDPGKQIEIDIIGPSLEKLQELAKTIQTQLGQTEGILFVRSSYSEGSPEVHVRLDRLRSANLNLRVSEVADFVESMVAGKRVGIYNDKGKQIDLTLYAQDGLIPDRESLKGLPLFTPLGYTVPLSDVAEVRTQTGPTAINHVEKERTITLTVNLKPEASLEASIQRVDSQVLAPLRSLLPKSYSLRLGGTADKLNTTINALRGSFFLAILIVYLLMVALFGSFIYPLIIIVTIPMAMTGSFFGITLAHQLSGGLIIFDVLAMLGLIILAGIVVNNAILIVHQQLNFLREGMKPEEALKESCISRLRPIFMSVITSVLGMLPLALGQGSGTELYRGLGVVMLSGLLISTLFTLFFVPALLSLMHDMQRFFRSDS